MEDGRVERFRPILGGNYYSIFVIATNIAENRGKRWALGFRIGDVSTAYCLTSQLSCVVQAEYCDYRTRTAPHRTASRILPHPRHLSTFPSQTLMSRPRPDPEAINLDVPAGEEGTATGYGILRLHTLICIWPSPIFLMPDRWPRLPFPAGEKSGVPTCIFRQWVGSSLLYVRGYDR